MNDGNGTPSMTNIRQSVVGFVGDASAIRPGTAAGRFDCPSVWSFLDGVSTSRFRNHAALRSVGDGGGLPASLSNGTAVSRHRNQSAVTYANGVGGHPPTMNIVDGYSGDGRKPSVDGRPGSGGGHATMMATAAAAT